MENDLPEQRQSEKKWIGWVMTGCSAIAAGLSAFSGYQSSLAAQESAQISSDQRDIDRPVLSVETLNVFDMFKSQRSPELYLDGNQPGRRPVLVANYAIRNDGNRDATITAMTVRNGSETQLINFSAPGDTASAVADDRFPSMEIQTLSLVSKLTVPAGAAEVMRLFRIGSA